MSGARNHSILALIQIALVRSGFMQFRVVKYPLQSAVFGSVVKSNLLPYAVEKKDKQFDTSVEKSLPFEIISPLTRHRDCTPNLFQEGQGNVVCDQHEMRTELLF